MSSPDIFGGRYRLVAELGRGGMGVVHRAGDARTGREVALKLVSHGRSPDEADETWASLALALAANGEPVRSIEAASHWRGGQAPPDLALALALSGHAEALEVCESAAASDGMALPRPARDVD
jgi:serine/threonine protein kinase